MRVRRLDLKAVSSDKGWDCAKWYLAMESPLSTSLVRTLARISMLHQENRFQKQLCFD